MRFLIFLLSYIAGWISYFVKEDNFLIYLFILFFYLLITDYISYNFHRYIIIDPMILSFASVMILSMMANKGNFVVIEFMLMVGFLLAYHILKGKILNMEKEKEEVNIYFYVKRLVLPLLYPVAFYFIAELFTNESLSPVLFWMFYFLVIIYYNKYIITAFYFLYFLISEILVVFYLLQFMNELGSIEKAFVYLFVIIASLMQFINQKQLKGGDLNLSFISKFFGKRVQKQKNS